MKKIAGIILVVSFLVSANAFAQTKIDPQFNYIRFKSEQVPASSLAAKMVAVKAVDEKIMVDCMIKTTDMEVVTNAVEELGGEVQTKLDTVITASIPLASVEDLADLEEVVYIEASKRLFSKMNFARSDGLTNVVSVQNGTGLSQAYTGDGVYLGAVDSGVDCSQADFTGRIVAYKNLGTNIEFSASQITAGDCSDSDFHGTHVTGIAASANGTYKGVAPDASIVGAELDASSVTEVINGVSYIFQKAQEVLAPAVANLSVGTSLGAHDSTSAFETGLNELLTGKEGRAIVNAAGNENINTNDDAAAGNVLGGIHALVNVGAGVTSAFDTIIRTKSTPSGFIGNVIMDVWLDSGSDCTIALDIYPLNSKAAVTKQMSPVSPGDSNESTPSEVGNLSAYVDFTDSNNANNGKQHAQVNIDFSSTGTDPTSLSYDLIFAGDSVGCTGHVWLWPDFTSHVVFTKNRIAPPSNTVFGYSYVNGDSNYIITIPGTASGVITVASYAARNTYVDINGATQSQNVYNSPAGGTGSSAIDISLFSSLGPGAGSANSQKPDITAPGEPIISSLASGVSVSDVLKGDSTHFKLEGTSMAAPFISGVVALLFEKNGCLTPAEVKTALINSVLTGDPFAPSGGVHSDTWGWGKVDALAAINSISSSTCEPDNPGDNPASGKKGCSLSPGESKEYSGIIWLMLLVGLLTISRRLVFKK